MNIKEQYFIKLIGNSLLVPDLKEFADLFILKPYSKQDFFVKEGNLNQFCGFVSNGIMRAFISDDQGKESNLRFTKKYGFISGNFAGNVPASMNIQCLTDCEIYVTSWKRLSDFIKLHKALGSYFNGLLASGHHSIVQRLSAHIRMGAQDRYELFLHDYPNLINLIPHYHVANFLGISTVQLSRIRSKIAKS